MLIRIADFFASLIVRSVFAVMRLLPREAALLLAKIAVRTILMFFPRSKSVGLRNLEIAFPDKTESERRQILKASEEVLARNLVTFSRLRYLNRERVMDQIDYAEGEEIYRELIKSSKSGGIIIATAHFASFEFTAQAHALLARPFSVLARGFGLPMLDSWWNSERERFGCRVFARKGGYRQIISRLKAGEDVAILCDQNVKGRHAVFVDLFGVTAATTKAVGHAAVVTGSPVIFGVAAETAPFRYRFYVFEIYRPQEADKSRAADESAAIMLRLHQALESVVRKYPEQWFWIHRRFKTRPPGEPETIYKEGLGKEYRQQSGELG